MIADRLKLVPDGEDNPDHGTIQPNQIMRMDEFKRAVANTKQLWQDGEDDP